MKTILLFQVVVGALGNVFLFSHSIPLVVLDRKRRHRWDSHTLGPGQPPGSLPWHSSHCHCSSCVTEARRVSGVFVYYVQRVARSTALCSTCVLSTYQSFTLSPKRAEWVMLRGRAPKVTGPSWWVCWMLSLLMSISVPVTVAGPQDTGSDTHNQRKWFCSSSPSAAIVLLWSVSDAVSYPHGLVQWLHGASAQTPPEGAVYPHPRWAPQMPPGDQSHPHHPDASGHLRRLLHTEFHVQFLHHYPSGVLSVVDASRSYPGFVSPLLAPSS